MMQPLISIQFYEPVDGFGPGVKFVCDYQLDAIDPEEIQAVEASVLWYTEGKGGEDMGVHYFERRTMADLEDGDLRQLRRFDTILPNSPLSYQGEIITVRWCVRVRAVMKGGKDFCHQEPFVLGAVRPGDDK